MTLALQVRTALVLGLLLPAALARAEPALQSLARSTVGAGQGVYAVAGDGSVLVAQAADRPVHPASVTKVATTLALLERLGPEHRFVTRIRAAGALADGRLRGDLVIEASGDPFLVDEGAARVLEQLGAQGVRIVEGDLIVHGPLLFDWQPDPQGRRLARVLAGAEGREAWAAVAASRGDRRTLAEAAVVFQRRTVAADATLTDLTVHRSPPLLHVLKVLNGYSNNVLHYASEAIGGPAAVEASARAHLPAALRAEVTIENGAGAGSTNRLSPRAAVAVLDALAENLAHDRRDLTAVLPVSGIDPGTLQARFTERPAIVVGKTGTFGSEGASALVGALRTRDRGVVRFAVLNHGLAVPDARARQDAFVRALVAATGAEPWPYTAPTRPDYLVSGSGRSLPKPAPPSAAAGVAAPPESGDYSFVVAPW